MNPDTSTSTKSETPMVPTLPPDVLVNVEVSGGYLASLQRVLHNMISARTSEEQELLKRFFSGEEKDVSKAQPWMTDYETISILAVEIEKQAVAQDKVKYVPITDFTIEGEPVKVED